MEWYVLTLQMAVSHSCQASDVELYKAVDDGVKVGFLGARLVYICGEDHATLYGGGGCDLDKEGMMLVIR